MDDGRYQQGMTVGRQHSPAIEDALHDHLARIFKVLLEEKSLYQNVRIDAAIFDSFADEDFPKEKLIAEFAKRPINPYSRGEGNDGGEGKLMRGAAGCDPLGTPHDEISFGFYLPNVILDCPKCKQQSTFLSLVCSGEPYFGGPYPLIREATEQVYALYYRCASCRGFYMAFQVLRIGSKFQLTGRSTPYRPALAAEWPKDIRQIVKDSFVASAEGDIPAGYYHMRTALEFYVKPQLGIAIEDKIDGKDLCERYNAQIDERLKSGFPSVAMMYSELSNGLHSRKGSAAELAKLANDLLNHVKAKALFQQYSG